MPEREAVRDRGDGAEVVADALAQRLEGFEAIAMARDMSADAFRAALHDALNHADS
jgi:hypothetical protein